MWLECIILRVASARFSRSTRFCRMVAGYFRVAFPFLFGGTFIEGGFGRGTWLKSGFPFLFGGTFIEGVRIPPSHRVCARFPFLFGGTFIEGGELLARAPENKMFPFLFGGTFIEGSPPRYR